MVCSADWLIIRCSQDAFISCFGYDISSLPCADLSVSSLCYQDSMKQADPLSDGIKIYVWVDSPQGVVLYAHSVF